MDAKQLYPCAKTWNDIIQLLAPAKIENNTNHEEDDTIFILDQNWLKDKNVHELKKTSEIPFY